MVALSLSDAQIAARVGVGAPTIRKFMGSPDGELGADSRKALLAYYREVATTSGTPIDEPPGEFIVAGASDAPVGDSAAYLARIDALVEQLAEDRAVIRDLVALLQGTPQGPGPERLIGIASADVAAVDEHEGKPRPHTMSPRRKPARGRLAGGRRSGSREGETA